MPDSVLIIGYGNDLRGDDAAGRRVADALARLQGPSLRVRSVHQLTPELAEEIAQSRTVVFIDASVESAGNGVQMRELEPSTTAEWRAHGSDPCRLMALARALYGHCPRAWLVTVSGTQFEIGAELSPAARHGVELAVARILDLIDPGEPAEGPNQGNV